MNLKKLTHKELVNLWISSQGDMTLIPGDKKRVVNEKLVRDCFYELLQRSPICKTRGLHGVKR